VTGAYTERGIKGRHGFMTEEVVDLAKNVHVVPQGVADIAVLTEPLTIAEKALNELDSVLTRMPWIDPKKEEKRGLNAVVLGAGPVGLLGALALAVRGFDTWVYSRESAKSARADWVESIGARYIESASLPVAQLGKRVGNVDLILEATGAASLAFAAMPAIGQNGIMIYTGVPGGKREVTLDAERIMRDMVLENQLLYGTVNAGPLAFEHAIADLGKFAVRWPKQVRALVTGRFPPENIGDVLSDGKDSIKSVIQFGAPSAAGKR
jgi:threonine dehydrogenase-like Zn-dependent dehydrogenase